nr:DUF1778 domain-containing protein [Gammaproteobacteria bacterium]
MAHLNTKHGPAERSARLGLRATPQQEALIRRAAEVTNKSVTEFVLDSACEAAEHALLDRRLFLVDEDQWEAFQEALDRPAEAKPRLRKLMQTPVPWECE